MTKLLSRLLAIALSYGACSAPVVAATENTFFELLSKDEIAKVEADATLGNVDAKFFYMLYLISESPERTEDIKRMRVEASQSGHPAAQSTECLIGAIVQDSKPDTSDCFRAATNGDPGAQTFLALGYSIGLFGLEVNQSAALNWERRAAFQGSRPALLNVGNRYSEGSGVVKDDVLAIHYWERAASMGDPEALRNLGRAHALGNGAVVDIDKAVSYLTKASDFGDGIAQYILGLLYRSKGNFQSAWVMQSLALKVTEAGELRDNIVKERIDLKNFLTSDEQKRASQMVKRWRKKEPTPDRFIGGIDFIRRLQSALNTRGFSAGEEDGIAGENTRNAYRQYADVLRLQDARFDTPAIYYVAYRLNLYGIDAEVAEPKASPLVKNNPEEPSVVAVAPTLPTPEASIQKPSVKLAISGGSGFLVNAGGHIVTNAHVVKDCSSVDIINKQGEKAAASIVKLSEFSDLALLRSDVKNVAPVTFHGGSPNKLGETLVVYGFPLTGTLSEQGNLTVGNLTALAGMRDDPSMLQISAPVQPGNSGGPVLDSRGQLAGVVVGKLNAIAVAGVTDDIPQNVNFAIKSSVLENFLQANSIDYGSLNPADKELPLTELAALAQNATVRVICYGE